MGAAYRRIVQSRECPRVGDDCPDAGVAKPKYLQERSRRRERSRQRVEAVALKLFMQRGFTEVTVEDVCAEAGFYTATFFRFFGSKEDAFFG
jgi:AcrR family transcriptional regulator